MKNDGERAAGRAIDAGTTERYIVRVRNVQVLHGTRKSERTPIEILKDTS